jgi:hypothetical protein
MQERNHKMVESAVGNGPSGDNPLAFRVYGRFQLWTAYRHNFTQPYKNDTDLGTGCALQGIEVVVAELDGWMRAQDRSVLPFTFLP